MTKLTQEEAIERIYDRSAAILKSQLDRGHITQDEYIEEIVILDEWATEMHKETV